MTTTNKSRGSGGCWRMKPLAGCLDASWDGRALRGNRHFGADPGWIGCLDAPMITTILVWSQRRRLRGISRCWPVVIPPGMGENCLCHTQAPG